MSAEAKVEGALGHPKEVKGVAVKEGYLNNGKVSQLKSEQRVELVEVEALDLGVTEGEGRVQHLGFGCLLFLLVNDCALGFALVCIEEGCLNHTCIRAAQP